MTNKTWTVTLPDGKTQVFTQDWGVKDGCVAYAGTTMVYELPVFLDGLAAMKAAGATVVEGTR